jgi:hypothetical protein
VRKDGEPHRGHVLIRGHWEGACGDLAANAVTEPSGPSKEVSMAKRHCRPSTQYRYEHYDPR